MLRTCWFVNVARASDHSHLDWSKFIRDLESIDLTEFEQASLLASAQLAFQFFEKILRELSPANGKVRLRVSREPNSEGGDCILPTDPLELGIALRTRIRTWEQFPYLENRFSGSTGPLNTTDNFWFMTLIPLEFKSIYRSIDWVRTGLANRGIPTLILETHLHEILNEYESTFPKNKPITKNFRKVLTEMKIIRNRIFNILVVSQLRAKYELKLKRLDKNSLGDVIGLLVSAKVDEMDGMESAFLSVTAWFSDRARFESDWVEVIASLSREIHNLAHPRRH